MKFRTKLLLGTFLALLGLVVAWELSGPEPLRSSSPPPPSRIRSAMRPGHPIARWTRASGFRWPLTEKRSPAAPFR